MFLPPLSRQRLYTRPSGYAAISRDLLFGRVHQGDDVELLEQTIRERLDVPCALAVNQCRLGIYLAIKALVAEGRRKVILSPFTVFDVVNMVLCAGAQPVFADVEPGSSTIAAAEVEGLLDDETAAVLVTHTHVLATGIDRLVSLCRSRNVALVEDAAVAFGTYHDGRPVGTLGDVGVFSFGLFKDISAVYGGMVVTRDEDLHRRMAAVAAEFEPITPAALINRILYGLTIDLATHPLVFRAATFWVFRFGLLHGVEMINKRTRNDPHPYRCETLPSSLAVQMSPAQARLVLSQLGRVEAQMERRVELARFYHRELAGIPELTLPALGEDRADGFLVFPVLVEDRDALLQHLMRSGRDCPSYYYRNCADLECFADFARDCPNSRRAAGQTVLLPTYPRYGLSEARKNVAAIRDFVHRAAL